MKKEDKRLPFFIFHLFNSISSYICAVNPRENGLDREAHSSLCSSTVILAQFT